MVDILKHLFLCQGMNPSDLSVNPKLFETEVGRSILTPSKRYVTRVLVWCTCCEDRILTAAFTPEIGSVGITSENVAKKFGITREIQDELACESHRRASAAQQAGKFNAEIGTSPVAHLTLYPGLGLVYLMIYLSDNAVPTEAVVVDSDGEPCDTKLITKDDGIRPQTTMEGLAKLKPAFTGDGSTTAGSIPRMQQPRPRKSSLTDGLSHRKQ